MRFSQWLTAVAVIVIFGSVLYMLAEPSMREDVVGVPEGFTSSISTDEDSVFAMQGVSWCPQCVRELPTFRELRRSQDGKKFGGKNLRVVQQDCEGEGKRMCEMSGVRKQPTFELHHEGRNYGYRAPLKEEAFNEFLLASMKEEVPGSK